MHHFPILTITLVFFTFFGVINFENNASAKTLNVPFTPQAPESNWDEPWKNACEEAAIVMIEAFYENKNLDVLTAKEKILKTFQVKEMHLGQSYDESVSTMIQLIDLLELPLEAYSMTDPTKEQLIKEIESGRPVILPVYAHEVPNPHYQTPLPNYHVLVLVGFDLNKDAFIVHDPGTSKGEAMEFKSEVILNAIHDLNPSDHASGEKQVIFTRPLNNHAIHKKALPARPSLEWMLENRIRRFK